MDLYTVSKARDFLLEQHGLIYSRGYISNLCKQCKLAGAIKPGHDWLIPEQSLIDFKPSRPGLKAGQKINRGSKK